MGTLGVPSFFGERPEMFLRECCMSVFVTAAEADQKLFQFLSRRCTQPSSVLHRWIRTGQVRINGGRAKPFDRVAEGDEIRVPPFAFAEAGTAVSAGVSSPTAPAKQVPSEKSRPAMPREVLKGRPHTFRQQGIPLPAIVAETSEYLLFCKPSGLPVQPGSGHTDCLTERLKAAYADADFMPTPVHRLDRDTSGLLLVGKTYRAVRRFSEALARHDGRIIKEYLAWVSGDCPWVRPLQLTDSLEKHLAADGRERMRVATPDAEARKACLTVRCLTRRTLPSGRVSLLQIRLHTGRTHQIRVQLAARGFPLLGDVKYGGPRWPDGLKLHAARLLLEESLFEVLPEWAAPLDVSLLPPLLEVPE